jgi:hypothetical protein
MSHSTVHLAVRTVSVSPDMNSPALLPKDKLRNISYKEEAPHARDGWMGPDIGGQASINTVRLYRRQRVITRPCLKGQYYCTIL